MLDAIKNKAGFRDQGSRGDYFRVARKCGDVSTETWTKWERKTCDYLGRNHSGWRKLQRTSLTYSKKKKYPDIISLLPTLLWHRPLKSFGLLSKMILFLCSSMILLQNFLRGSTMEQLRAWLPSLVSKTIYSSNQIKKTNTK